MVFLVLDPTVSPLQNNRWKWCTEYIVISTYQGFFHPADNKYEAVRVDKSFLLLNPSQERPQTFVLSGPCHLKLEGRGHMGMI